MKVVILAPGLSKYLPYISLYEQLFQEMNVSYRLLQWDRMSTMSIQDPNTFCNGYGYSRNPIKRMLSYLRYLAWIRKEVSIEKPNVIVVATIAPAVFLLRFLRNWKGRYILDIRDYTPIIKYCKPLVAKAIRNSALSVISSKGFLSWLPTHNYYPIYNFGLISSPSPKKTDTNKIHIATIGFLRDYDANVRLIDALGNKDEFILSFHGVGIALNQLVEFTELRGYKNVRFTGAFKKEDENLLYEDADIINVLMPLDSTGCTLLSNRFMNAVVNQRPMLVSANSFQAELVQKYQLGICIQSDLDISSVIKTYLKNIEYKAFTDNCNKFLYEVRNEHETTINVIRQFIETQKLT